MLQVDDLTDDEVLRLVFNQLMMGIRTTLPAIVESEPYVKGKFWCVDVTPAIKQVANVTGETVTNPLQKLSGVPIFGMSYGGFSVTCPIKKGNTVLLSVSDRGIDGFQQEADIQDPPELNSVRHHDLTDAIVIGGGLVAVSPSEYYQDGVSVQNADASTHLRVNDDSIDMVESGGGAVSLSGGVLTIDADIQHNGSNTTTGTIAAPIMNAANSLVVAGKEQADHGHLPGTYNVGGTPVSGQSGTQP